MADALPIDGVADVLQCAADIEWTAV